MTTINNYQTSYNKIKPKIKSPYTFIYLIRHCHSEYLNKRKIKGKEMSLSEIGYQQRSYLTKRLLSIKIDKIYVSEIRRAQETAEIFAKKTNKKIIIDERLNEINWQKWYKIKYFNMSEKERVKKIVRYKQLDKQLDKKQAAVRQLLADIYFQNKGKKITVFTHGNLIRAIITSILNADIIGFLSTEIYQSSISKIVIDRDGYVKINYINSICHLPHQPKEDLFKSAISQ